MAEDSLSKQMKAQVLEAFNQPYVLKDLPVPEIASDDDLLIKVDAASYCHTDAVLASGQMRPNPPVVCYLRGIDVQTHTRLTAM